jgi:hypothetical protein
MALSLSTIRYSDLNGRQQEGYNFAKVSAVLADYGYVTMRLLDDWQGADFIAQHRDGPFIKVQLKSRLIVAKKYLKKDLYIAFRVEDVWYLFPHDEILKRILDETNKSNTRPWKERGQLSFPKLTKQMRQILSPYKIGQSYGLVVS